MRTRRKLIGSHTCSLNRGDDSDSGLPKCDPSAGYFYRILRRVRKLFLVSFLNSYTHVYIKSQPSLLAERKRHIRSKNWFVIHPLSIFAAYREMLMTVLWLGYVITEPFILAFLPANLHLWGMIQLAFLFDVMINFIHGYIDPNTLEIILDLKLIVKRYLLSYFLPDLLSNTILPVCLLINGTSSGKNVEAMKSCASWTFVQTLLRFFRMFTAFEYLQRAADFFDIGRQKFAIILISVVTFMFLHFCTCWIIGLAVYLEIVARRSNSFLQLADISSDTGVHTRYTCGLCQACTLFFRCCVGICPVINTEEKILQGVIMIWGLFYFAYVVVLVYDIVTVSTAVGNRFEQVWNQLEIYLMQHRLPKHLQKRIFAYYEYRFEKQYFRESVIFETLSEHLKYEVMLFTCMPLVNKANFFRNLPKHLIGQIIAALRREVFLYNDVVFKCGDKPECMYFIHSGRVAAINRYGYEFLHFEDGDNFGESQLMVGGERKYSAVSADITEFYILSYVALRRFLKPYPQYRSMISASAKKKHGEAELIIEKIMKSTKKEKSIVQDTLYLY